MKKKIMRDPTTGQRRTRLFTVRLSEYEWAQIKKAAREDGKLTVAVWIRWIAAGR